MGTYKQLQSELLGLETEITKHERAQEATTRELAGTDLKPMEDILSARLAQYAAKLKGLYARRNKKAAELEEAEVDRDIEVAQATEIAGKKALYSEICTQERAAAQKYDAFRQAQATELMSMLQRMLSERETACQSRSKLATEAASIYYELRGTNNAVPMLHSGWSHERHTDLLDVVQKALGS